MPFGTLYKASKSYFTWPFVFCFLGNMELEKQEGRGNPCFNLISVFSCQSSFQNEIQVFACLLFTFSSTSVIVAMIVVVTLIIHSGAIIHEMVSLILFLDH